jgi:hypothetical protein
VNGEHEVRLERIEERIDELHDKVDELVENEAENRTDIVWLTWAVRVGGERGGAEWGGVGRLGMRTGRGNWVLSPIAA